MKAWKQISEPKLVYGGWRNVYVVKYELPNGKQFDFEYSAQHGESSAAVIALTKDRQVIIARQYRVGPAQIMEELPGGGVEKGEDKAQAVLRELREETGYEAGSIEHIGSLYKHAWISSEWDYYLATDCVLHPDGLALDEMEAIETKLISINELFKNARSGKMTDTEAVFLAYDRLKMLEGNNEKSS